MAVTGMQRPAQPGDLKEALGKTLRRLGVAPRIEKETLRRQWARCVGDDLALHSEVREFRGGRLIVTVDSAPLAHSLALSEAGEIRARVNGLLGHEAVRRIYFRIGSLRLESGE